MTLCASRGHPRGTVLPRPWVGVGPSHQSQPTPALWRSALLFRDELRVVITNDMGGTGSSRAAHPVWISGTELRLATPPQFGLATEMLPGGSYRLTHWPLLLHFSLLRQSRLRRQSTHWLSTQNCPLLQSRSRSHSTHRRLTQRSLGRQSLLRRHRAANALSASAESPTRPSTPPVAALSMPRRADCRPRTRVMSSNR